MAMESDWQIIGAAVQGLSHQKQGLPCQDALKYHCLPGGILLVALADGAGSAIHAELGAQAAVQASVDWLITNLEHNQPSECCEWAEVIWETFQNARNAVEQLGVERDEPLRSFATTLTCLVATPEQLIVGQLGDGAVVAVGEDEGLKTVTTLQRGEYANETNFLTQDQALELVSIQVIAERVQGLAVMSDGLTRLALKRPDNVPHPPFFKPLFSFVESSASSNDPAQANDALMEFLASPRVCERTDDDKSLVLALRSNCR
jgi:serine/threonine protein phosphatase PrpC